MKFIRRGKLFLGFARLYHFLLPPPEWRWVVIILLGVFVGVIAYTFRISNAASYLSEDPKACINCHVMLPQYATWQRSSHARVAHCSDCHVPHDNVARKYFFKMKDGSRHATMFTFRLEPQVIQIKEEGSAVVQENCLRCHQEILQDVSIHQTTYETVRENEQKYCWDCHREVPHGRVRSLSATPYTQAPQDELKVPVWLEKFIPVVEKYLEGR